LRLLIFWDIYGRLGRKAFSKEFDAIKSQYSPDLCIVNIENITSWRWPAFEHAEFIENHGVDLMTLWDHSFDNRPNIDAYFEKNNSKIIRPANFYESDAYPLPWKWYQILEKDGYRILVIQLLWEVFMSIKVDNPFEKITQILSEVPKESYDTYIVEFHRETTAELYGMARYLDSKAALIYGTHTHIQTNDAHIMPGWSWVITDIGMNGPYDGVIWAEYSSVEKRFFTWIPRGKIEQKLNGKYVMNAIVVDIDTDSWLCSHIENISFTGNL